MICEQVLLRVVVYQLRYRVTSSNNLFAPRNISRAAVSVNCRRLCRRWLLSSATLLSHQPPTTVTAAILLARTRRAGWSGLDDC